MSVDSELQRHRADWENFMGLTVKITGGLAVLLILMAVFLVNAHYPSAAGRAGGRRGSA
jgi:hypothetical protein